MKPHHIRMFCVAQSLIAAAGALLMIYIVASGQITYVPYSDTDILLSLLLGTFLLYAVGFGGAAMFVED